MNRDRSFQFIRLGRYLERCDMVTRIADVGTAALSDDLHIPAIEISLWSNLLASLSATSAYRRQIGPIIEPFEVIDFVFNYNQFPRSVRYSLDRIERIIQGFSNNTEALKTVGAIYKKLDRFQARKKSREQLHEFIDLIQYDLAHLNTTIDSTWFSLDK